MVKCALHYLEVYGMVILVELWHLFITWYYAHFENWDIDHILSCQKDLPYLNLIGKLKDIFYEDLEKWSCYPWGGWGQLNIIQNSNMIMGLMASQVHSVWVICSAVCSGSNQRNHKSSTSLAFVRGIHQLSMNSSCKGPVTHDVIMIWHLIISPHKASRVYYWWSEFSYCSEIWQAPQQ